MDPIVCKMRIFYLGVLYALFSLTALTEATDLIRKAAPSRGEQLRFKVNDTAARFIDGLGLQSNAQKLAIFRDVSKAAEDALEVPEENRLSEVIPESSDDENSISRDPIYIDNTLYIAKQRIIGGGEVQDNDPDFMNCVAIGWGSKDHPGFECTGTLVADNLVLTAKHCQKELGRPRWVFFGNDTATAKADNIVGVADSFPCDNADLLLLLLTSRVTSIRPCRIARTQVPPDFPSQNAPAPFRFIKIAGFGNTNAPGTSGAGKKRFGMAGVCGDFPDRYGYHESLEFVAGKRGQPGSCYGDSGGPAYVLISGHPILLGCTSRMTKTAVQACGDGAIYVRVDRQASWIAEIAKKKDSRLP
jgi:hypothetical protein